MCRRDSSTSVFIYSPRYERDRESCVALNIKEDVTIGHGVILHGCYIGNRVVVGMGAIILDGAHVEDDVMIAAGSVVPPNKRLESGFLYLGNPVRKVRPLRENEKAHILKNASNYVENKTHYMNGNVKNVK